MKVFIGIDDTDNLETRGTGHHARMLGMALTNAGLIDLRSVTRHQLLVDRRIPYTSHNSSACLAGFSHADPTEIIGFCREFLLHESAHDSDAGLCVSPEDKITETIREFGNRAKKEILTIEEAKSLAAGAGIFLDGFLNTQIGMIGSLAAVGLRSKGEDGRLLWLKNLRETTGIFTCREFKQLTGIQSVIDKEYRIVPENTCIHITEWTRPVMLGGLITLIIEKSLKNELYDYQSASKEFIKSITE